MIAEVCQMVTLLSRRNRYIMMWVSLSRNVLRVTRNTKEARSAQKYVQRTLIEMFGSLMKYQTVFLIFLIFRLLWICHKYYIQTCGIIQTQLTESVVKFFWEPVMRGIILYPYPWLRITLDSEENLPVLWSLLGR